MPRVEASMILSGMGPISPLSTTSAKLFASLYALREWFDFRPSDGNCSIPLGVYFAKSIPS